QLQYVYSPSTGKGSWRTAFAKPASDLASAGSWCVYEWNPGTFGLGNGLWLDFPHVALSKNFVWYSANIFDPSDPPVYQQTVIWRIQLDPVVTCDGPAFDFFLDNKGTFTQVEGATDTMYFATHMSTNTILIYQWDEAQSAPFLPTPVPHSAYPDALSPPPGPGRVCPGPDQLNWCGKADGRILTGWRNAATGVIGFMWNASQGMGDLGTFDFPYVHVARFNATNLTLIDEPIIWNPN